MRLVFKHHPMRFHKHAMPASQLACLAQEKGQFWEAHDLLFEYHRRLDRKTLISIGKRLGFEADAVKALLDSDRYKERIRGEIAEGEKAGVRGTPFFVVNDKPLWGAHSYRNFRAVIEGILADEKPEETTAARQPSYGK